MIDHARDIYERQAGRQVYNDPERMVKMAKQALDHLTVTSFNDFLKRSNLKADENMNFKETVNSIYPDYDIVDASIYPTRDQFIHNARCKKSELFMKMNHHPLSVRRKLWHPCPTPIAWWKTIIDQPNHQLWVEITFENGTNSPRVKLVYDKGFIEQPRGNSPTSYMTSCSRKELDLTLEEINWLINPEFIKCKEGFFGTLRWKPSHWASYVDVKFTNNPLEEKQSSYLDDSDVSFYLNVCEENKLWAANKHISEDLDLMLPCLKNNAETDNFKTVTNPKVLVCLYQAYVKFLYNNILTLTPIARLRKAMSSITLSGFRKFLNHSGLDCSNDFCINNQSLSYVNFTRCYFPSQALFIHNASCRRCSRIGVDDVLE